jgi:murein L,D-transpeptidase YafK
MIHGNCVSIGCLAIKDEPFEDLFVLVADVGISDTKVVLAP